MVGLTSLPLTNMRDINGWVECFVLRQLTKDFSCYMRLQMKKSGFYIIKDDFFTDMNDPYLKRNKSGNRPHYYCFEDACKGIYWMIPLSSQVDKYKKIIDKKISEGKSCDILHIVKLPNDRETTFLIQDMFPITEKYIEREYRIAANHMVLAREQVIKDVDQKARKVVAMLKRGVKFTPTQPDIISILNKLNI